MNPLHVDLGPRSYPIHLVRELPAELVAREAVRIRAALADGSSTPAGAPILLVTDSNVGPLYAADVVDALAAAGFVCTVHEVPAGEPSKSLDTVAALVDTALAAGLGRRDLVIALGGGVVGDVAGFASAVLHRGVGLIQVPTTLLAQVDSAVGGKTGVNHPTGKNLIGSFWQPRAVVSSHAVLETLPDRERRCGLAEALKHGFIADVSLVDFCRGNAEALRALELAPTLHLVEACCRIKAAIVASDERERGPRAVLNFGHTLGHAYERLMGYGKMTHGEAVSLGMIHAARVSEQLGVAPSGLATRLVEVLSGAGLPVDTDAEELPAIETLLAAARTDKKADRDSIGFVMLADFGKPVIRQLSWDELTSALQ